MYRLFHQISSPFILGLDLSGNGCCKYIFKDDFVRFSTLLRTTFIGRQKIHVVK